MTTLLDLNHSIILTESIHLSKMDNSCLSRNFTWRRLNVNVGTIPIVPMYKRRQPSVAVSIFYQPASRHRMLWILRSPHFASLQARLKAPKIQFSLILQMGQLTIPPPLSSVL